MGDLTPIPEERGERAFAAQAMRLVCAVVVSLALGVLYAPCAHAQTVTIRLVEAKSGKPIRNKTVSIAFYVEDASMSNGRRRVAFPDGSFWTNLDIDKEGLGAIAVPKGATIVEVGKGLNNDGLKSTEKATDLFLCQDHPDFTRPDAGYEYGRVEEVLRTGYMLKNPDCQPRLKVPAAPGQFVVVAWPPSRNPLGSGITW
jgi:hypothetical protein